MPPKRVQGLPLRPNPGPYNHKIVGLPVNKRVMFMELYRAGISITSIAEALEFSRATAFRWQKNIRRYGSIKAPDTVPKGRPFRLSIDDQFALFEELCQAGWMYLDEMKDWLLEEREILIDVSTIGKYLKKSGWTKKSLKLVSRNRSEALRKEYLYDMQSYSADDL
jgi:transposase